MNELGIKR